ncbi:MAG: hypothetical protein A2Y57_00570 [Candidatus Woykebacteria bacterium RBG_13_40_7b]|uniref:Polysaccharide biosynthesis protein C-terminal domain-containing protein n=1 Tax=Candidatus Woykebacteria bacterium RBG_13_40_7b TaxID=1802594 RepID=A0A1G1WBP5_9BACT|nr:MAG: hypothetical protein A2Y57_00570 [Candidatus Woykebacteria bacterium RBG_13_40_7b]
MSSTSKIAFNTLIQLFGRFLTSLITAVVVFLISKNLGASTLGDFITIITYISLFFLVVDFGLNAIAVKDLSTDEDKIPFYFRNLFGLRIILSIAIIFLSLVILSILPYRIEIKLTIALGSFLILFQGLFLSAIAVFQTKLRYEKMVLCDVFGSIVTLILIFLAIKTGANLLVLISIYLIGAILRVILGFYLVSSYVGKLSFEFNRRLLTYLMLSALPLGLTIFFAQLNASVDKIILSLINLPTSLNISNSVAVGVYGLGYKIFETAILFPTFFVNSSYPIMIKHRNESIEKFRKTLKKLVLVLVSVSLLGIILGFPLAPYLVNIFQKGGEDLSGSILILRILLLFLPIFYLSALFLWTAVTLGLTKILPLIYGFGSIINVSLNLIFIPKYGYISSAYVAGFTEFIILISLFYFTLEHLKKYEDKNLAFGKNLVFTQKESS